MARLAQQGSSRYLLILLALLVGCASTPHHSRPFFLPEEEMETHGRQTWYDRLVELDPGDVSCVIAGDYQERPPRKIAVLPFLDRGEGNYIVDKVSVKTRNEEELNRWSWSHANRVRRAVAGELATREFIIVPLLMIDAVLDSHGITDGDKLNAVSPDELGRWLDWLDVDTVVYGELLNYEAYYAFLAASWTVSARVRMVSTKGGDEMFSCTGTRYSTTFTPVIDPIDFVVNSAVTVIHLRDITLARTEREVGREIVHRLPKAQRNISEFQDAAKERAQGSASRTDTD